jgi:ribosomal protein S18 acetylase RimI-like enzyme
MINWNREPIEPRIEAWNECLGVIEVEAIIRQRCVSETVWQQRSMIIRSYKPDHDAVSALTVFDHAFPAAHPFLAGSNEFECARKVVEVQLAVWTVRLADDGRGVIGFIAVDDEGYIPALYVLPTKHNRGAGSALLASIQEPFRQLNLHVFEDNGPAVRFYRSKGFHVVDEERAVDGLGRGHYRLKMARIRQS